MNSRLIVILLLVAVSTPGRADEFHNVNQIVGDRAMGMAGAYTAVSDDPAGLYYNPAGLVYADSSSISASVNTLQYQTITYDEVLAGEFDWQRTSTQLLPNFFGVIQPLGPFKGGLASAIPNSVSENQDQQFEDFGNVERYIVNLNNKDITYNFGPGLGYAISEQVSVGLTLNYHYRVFERNFNQYVRLKNDDFEWTNSYLETKEHGIRPKIGLMWSPVDKIALGVTLDRTWVLSSLTRFQSACFTTASSPCATDANGNPVNDVAPNIQTLDNRRTYPWQVRIGAAWFANPGFLVSADLIYNSAVEESFLRDERVQTFDIALGTEYYLTANYALRGGFYTAQSNTREPVIGESGQEPHLDIYGVTSSLTRFSEKSSVTLGASYATGEGKSQLVAADVDNLQDTRLLDVGVFVSTAYRY